MHRRSGIHHGGLRDGQGGLGAKNFLKTHMKEKLLQQKDGIDEALKIKGYEYRSSVIG